MSERGFNIFIYFDVGIAREYGMRHHRLSGTDAEMATLLQTKVESDFALARRFPLRRTFTVAEWMAFQRAGLDLGLSLVHPSQAREFFPNRF